MIMQLHKNRENLAKVYTPSMSYRDRTRRPARRRRHQMLIPELGRPHARMVTTTMATTLRLRSNTSAHEDFEIQASQRQHRLQSTI